MVAITAVLYGNQVPPAVQVTVTGLTGADLVNVYREAPNAPRALVRGGVEVEPTDDALLLVDVAGEVGRPLVYVAETYTGSAVATQVSAAPVTIPDPGKHVLSNSLTGEAVLVDLVADPDERETPTRGVLLQPIGSARPVPVYDTPGSDVGTLRLYTDDAATTAALVALLADGRPLVSRHPWDGTDVPGQEVLYFTGRKRARRSRAGDRVWELEFQVVDLQDPRLATSLVDLADLAAYWPGTLADVAADHTTLLGLAQDDLGAA
jgi:hypothetical protein